MSWWNSFTSTFGATAKTLTGGGSYLNEEEQKRQQDLMSTVKSRLASLDAELDSNPVTKAAKNATKATGDLLLKAAVGLNNRVISPYITRPAATLALLTDIQSPLYKKSQYEEGFQFKDIKTAYERSKKVSTFQALTKSDLTPIGSLASLVLPTGGIDIDKVDLWNDENIKKNFVDNAVGRWFTGIGDFVVGNAAVLGAAKAVSIGAKAAAKPVGLYTKGKTIEELALDMDNGINYAKSNGLQGTQTVSGNQMITLAESKDWGTIEDIVGKYSTNERLIPLIHEASDASVVKDIILGDKGNLAALERLASTRSDYLFDLADVKSQLTNKFIQTGKVYLPEGAAVPRIQKAFDDAINANPQFKKLRDAFFDEDYSLTPGGKAYMPLEPKIGTGLVIKGQDKLLGAKAVIRKREFELPGFLDSIIGQTAGGMVLRGVRFAARGTEALPTGFVSFSGMRPMQARVEFNAFLNNMKLFRDGTEKIETSPGVYEKVVVIRQRMEDKYMKTLGTDSISQTKALKEIDNEVGTLLAYKNGMYNQTEINAYLSEFQSNVSRGLQSVRENGFGIDIDGSIMSVDPKTVRQLAESYRFTPWDDIERQLSISREASGAKRLAKESSRNAQDVFAELNRIWTFDVLARPSYAFKQSLFEPIISSGLSQGLSFVFDDIIKTQGRGAANNFYNWSRNQISTKITNRAELKKVNALVGDKSIALSKAIRLKEEAQASVEELLTLASPATKQQHLAKAQKELKAAKSIVDDIELELREAIVPYGVTEAIPSMATLERRIAYLESKPNLNANPADIADAKAAIANYRNTISKLATNKKVIMDADDAVQKAYSQIDNSIKELSEAQIQAADVFGKSAKFKTRYYGKENEYRDVNGQLVSINSFIQESSMGTGNMFTAAVREEVRNARTTQINFIGELTTGQTNAAIKRKIPMGRIGIDDPTYFEEIAHLANRQYRGDPLMDLILGETPMKQLQEWAMTDTGRAYLRQFNVYDAKEIPTYLADKASLVKRTFPSFEARAAILKGDVNAQQMQKFLAPYANDLYDIIPNMHNYGATTFGVGSIGKVNQSINNFAAGIFQKLASVENPIRATLFNKIALDNVARKATYLEQQGIKMTPARYNALRQSAGREALQEMEKTLYTINNPNRLINSLRGITAFPAANVNAFMRYGRLAAKDPVRATGFMYNYGRTFQTFGIDENGNPTTDVDKISHLVIPGSKDIPFGIGKDSKTKEIALSAQSLGFLLNRPSPSFIATISLGQIMQNFPSTEDDIEEFMTIGGTNYYKAFYPYGVRTSVKDAFTPPWLNSLRNAIVGPEGKADYLASWKSVYNYNAMLVEMGIQEDMPSDSDIRNQVKALWFSKFASSFISPFAGIPYKVDTNPMGLQSTLYYKLQEKYKAAGMANQDARDAAGEEMLSLLGPKFMIDRVSFTGSSKNINMPATIESYQRVFSDNDDLVGRLANIEPGEINLVGLLTADLDYDPAQQSNNILTLLSNANTTLPGTTKKLNELKLNPREIEVERLKQRTWGQFTAIKEALEAKITDGKTLRSHPELKVVLDELVQTTLKGQSQAWFDEYNQSISGDTSYKYGRALTEIVTDKKFMAKNGTTTFWKDTEQFLTARSMFAKVYQSMPDYDPRKALLVDAYNIWVEANVGQWDGNLKTIVTRYFNDDKLKEVN